MIKAATVFTYELDDPQLALAEVKKQLEEKITFLKNSVGIIMCDPEFIASRVVTALAEGLPFPIAGTTTTSQAVPSEAGVLMLTMLVLTSDDASFSTGLAEQIREGEDMFAALSGPYQEAATKLPEKPKLAIIFPPLILGNAGDCYVEVFEKLVPNTPIFGTIAIDDSMTYENSAPICGVNSGHTMLSFILISGDITPRFFMATISGKRLLPYSGEITKSSGNIIEEINDVTAADYFESIGLAKNGVIDEGVQFLPLLLDFKKREDYDGVPVVRALVTFDECGAGICRGNIYENSVFKMSTFDGEDVLETTTALMDKLNNLENVNAILMFSCMVRRMSFGNESLAEAQRIAEIMNPNTPYMMAYSGGEICPTSYSLGAVTNRFHNYSLIVCVL